MNKQREEFNSWWEDFQALHENWNLGDREAILFAAYQAGAAKQNENISDLIELLECAQNGLNWYREEYPKADSSADDDFYKDIEETVARIRNET